MAHIRTRLTYANVLASIAIFLVLGGTSVAAVALSKNSVASKHIKNGQVKKPDLARDAVTSGKVKNGSLRAKDFRAGQIPAGPQGPKGDQGVQGPKGDPAVYQRTRLAFAGSITTPETFGFFVPERVVGTFTKQLSDSTIELVATGHGSSSGSSCTWQLRIDGKNNQGSSASVVDGTEAMVRTNEAVPYSINSVFEGLAAGSHQVTLSVRALDGNCTSNPGNLTRVVYVNETS